MTGADPYVALHVRKDFQCTVPWLPLLPYLAPFRESLKTEVTYQNSANYTTPLYKITVLIDLDHHECTILL